MLVQWSWCNKHSCSGLLRSLSSKSSLLSFGLYAKNKCMGWGETEEELDFSSILEVDTQNAHLWTPKMLQAGWECSVFSSCILRIWLSKAECLLQGRWRMKNANFLSSSKCKPNLTSRVPETRKHELGAAYCPGSGIPRTSWPAAIPSWLGTGHCSRNQRCKRRNGSSIRQWRSWKQHKQQK